MKRITQKLFAAAIICAFAGFVFCAINGQQWNVIRQRQVDEDVNGTRDAVITITRSYKQLGLGLFILSGALMVAAGLVINRYGYNTVPAKPEQQ